VPDRQNPLGTILALTKSWLDSMGEAQKRRLQAAKRGKAVVHGPGAHSDSMRHVDQANQDAKSMSAIGGGCRSMS
jgi:hypothetical protein